MLRPLSKPENHQPFVIVPNSPLPRNWERVFGYKGSARYLAVYWTPCGDEAMYADGQVSGTAHWPVYQELIRQYRAAITEAMLASRMCPPGEAWNAVCQLGSSDHEASHCLLLDLTERTISIADIEAGIKFVLRQHPPAPPIKFTEEMLTQALAEARAVTAARFFRPFQLCACLGGWVAASDGGYDPCLNGCDHGILWLG